ncbi:MAG: diacylglycerol kinase family lipid kinase, partial [Bacteroidales bacterium]
MNTEKKKILAIINPISGIRPKDNIPTLIHEQINSDKFDIQIAFTEYAGHATELAKKAVEDGIEYVLAIGGDGTINETAKALIHSDTALGIIPLGSGNGLARHLEIPLETSKALKIINEENVIAIDYCTANDHIFFCTAGLGFDAWISKKFAEDKHRGSLTYIKNVLAEYLRYEPRYYKIITEEGTVVEKAFLVACANASQYGNNAYIAPGANMQDGLMDITVLRPFNHLEAPVLSVQLFTKQLPKNSKIQTFRDKSVKIILEKEEVMHIDGEPIMMDKEILVKTIKGGLKILVPTNPSH